MNKFIYIFFYFFALHVHADDKCYDVKLDSRKMFCVSQGVGAITPLERSQLIENKIKKVATDYSVDLNKLSVNGTEEAYTISSGDLIITSLTKADIYPPSEQTLEEYAENILSEVKTTISIYRSVRSPEELIKGAAYSVVALLVLWFCLWILGRGYQYLSHQVDQWVERYISKIKISSYQLISPHRVKQVLQGALSLLRTLLILVSLYFFVPLIMSFFPWTAPYAGRVVNYFLDPFQSVLHKIVSYLPNIFYIIVIIFITRYFLKMIQFLFNEVENGNISFGGFHKELVQPTYKLVRIIIFAVAGVMIFPYLPGSSSPAFQGVSVFLGVLVSFGSGSSIANIVSGVVITYMRPFRVGDRVKISDTVGDVVEKTFLITRIRTIKNVDVTIPNSMVLGSHIINYSSSAVEQGLILNTTITIGYDASWKTVHELLKQAAKRTDLIDQAKEPFILQTALNDFYVAYELNAYTKHANKMALIYSDLHKNIQDTFNEGGVEIMSPHYGALRDGNEITIPANYRSKDYQVPRFGIKKD